jgi:murein DD-endopeptidase MepM/ murein hydrolase activator NlpD
MTHSVNRRGTAALRGRVRRALAILAALSVLVAGTILGQSAESAWAKDYPSWTDVQNARSSVAAKQAEITRLDGLLASLATDVTATQAAAKQKGIDFAAAQLKFDNAAYASDELQKQADTARAKADKSKQQAGELAARLASTGGADLSTTLFFSGNQADSLLSQLGLASMVKDQSAGLYQKAIRDQNSAQSLTDQAKVATAALRVLSDAAQKALADAAVASEKAAASLAEQQANKGRLDAQRASLVQNSATIEADYNAGVQAALAAAAEYARLHPPAPKSSGGGGSAPSASGWVRPTGGHISSGYGMRVNPVDGGYRLHAGTDLAPGCNAPIYAANAGTVIFAGWSGGYGNFVIINHGGGLTTGYGHIVDGGILVHVGEAVGAGQQIARVGSTGNSTGCHLHFETRPGGVAVDPVPFMRARGVELAN